MFFKCSSSTSSIQHANKRPHYLSLSEILNSFVVFLGFTDTFWNKIWKNPYLIKKFVRTLENQNFAISDVNFRIIYKHTYVRIHTFVKTENEYEEVNFRKKNDWNTCFFGIMLCNAQAYKLTSLNAWSVHRCQFHQR